MSNRHSHSPHIGTCRFCDQSTRSKEPRISPSKVGAMCVPNFCPCCAWRLLRLRFKKPYQIPAAVVLDDLDAFQKRVAWLALHEDGALPKFFGRFDSATEILTINSMSCHHKATDLDLYGKPDLIVRFPDQSIGILDFKTSRLKSKDDPVYLQRQAQVNFYAYLAQNLPAALEVSKLALLYFHVAPVHEDDFLDCYDDSGMYVTFTPTFIEVELDPDRIIVPILERIRELLDLPVAPAPRKGCCDCSLIQAHAELFTAEEELTDAILTAMTLEERQRMFARKKWNDATDIADERQRAIRILRAAADPFGIVANWDWDGE